MGYLATLNQLQTFSTEWGKRIIQGEHENYCSAFCR